MPLQNEHAQRKMRTAPCEKVGKVTRKLDIFGADIHILDNVPVQVYGLS